MTIYGSPQSKANGRRSVFIGGKPRFIKSEKAVSYANGFRLQCPLLNPMFEGDVHVQCKIYYDSRRPDLDASIILDGMQGRIYRNDRQVKKQTIEWGLDTKKPRCEITVSPFQVQ